MLRTLRDIPDDRTEEPSAGTASLGHLLARHLVRGTATILVAVLMALVIRTLFFEPFNITSASMEETLFKGDAVLVSKLQYGARIEMPLFDADERGGAFQLPGLGGVERGDVVVFHYPVEGGAVSAKTHYVKRAVGLPGDWLEVDEEATYVNGTAALPPGGKSERALSGGKQDVMRGSAADRPHAHLLGAMQGLAGSAHAAEEAGAGWTSFIREEARPVYVPAAGDTVGLTKATWPVYRDLIRRHERQTVVHLGDGQFLVDGERKQHYVFEQDYYFMLGDNRDNSADSRTWGFVPADHLVGKVVIVYFSWDDLERRVRGERLFRPVR